jgi:nicotinamidase-related amidase
MLNDGRALIGWVVDVQQDFMDPQGRLYVRDLGDPSDIGAVGSTAAITEAVEWMEAHASVLVFTGDWHGMEDGEIDPVAPDPAQGTYPPHCMGRSADPAERSGAELIPSIRPSDPVVLEVGATEESATRVARTAVRAGRPVFIQKTRFDVFTGNPATEAFLKALEVELGRPFRVVVVGVARDVCVTQAVDGFLARGIPVVAVQDAMWGLGLEGEAETVARWARAGGNVLTLEVLKNLSDSRSPGPSTLP